MSDAEPETPETPPAPPAPLLTLRESLPRVVETEAGLAAAGDGPVAIDAERASGYRYSNRAYLLQLRREGSGTWLIDPTPLTDLQPLVEALRGTEWILHAATQDLPCLAELGLRPDALFDTELAGRLLGYPRVGLATLVETILGKRLKKEHSAVDWSQRPLPADWLEYAALDVEVLVELRAALGAELQASGKAEWARQEFEYLRGFEPAVREEPWRRTSGSHRVKGRRGLAAIRALWQERDAIARQRDVSPGRIIPDAAIVAAATALPTDRAALLSVRGFHGRGADRYAGRFAAVLRDVAALPEEQLPRRTPRGDGPPQARAWADRDPVAARRLSRARETVAALAEELNLPVENLLTPDHLRRVLWRPPGTREPERLGAAVDQQLASYGARRWQVDLAGPLLVEAILLADQPVEPGSSDVGSSDS